MAEGFFKRVKGRENLEKDGKFSEILYFCGRIPYQSAMTKYPIGLQNFQGLREDGYVYVDKTAFVYELATTGKYYFLSRPRRFGKSLLISTIEAYFQGKKELFKGLALEQLEKEWVAGLRKKYAVKVDETVLKTVNKHWSQPFVDRF